MSSYLNWEPVDRPKGTLPDELKFALRKRFREPVDTTMHNSSVPYLEGLRDAGVKGAQALLDAIEKHGEVTVKEEY